MLAAPLWWGLLVQCCMCESSGRSILVGDDGSSFFEDSEQNSAPQMNVSSGAMEAGLSGLNSYVADSYLGRGRYDHAEKLILRISNKTCELKEK